MNGLGQINKLFGQQSIARRLQTISDELFPIFRYTNVRNELKLFFKTFVKIVDNIELEETLTADIVNSNQINNS